MQETKNFDTEKIQERGGKKTLLTSRTRKTKTRWETEIRTRGEKRVQSGRQ